MLDTGQDLALCCGVDAQADLMQDRLVRLPMGVADGGHPEVERLRGHAGGGEAGKVGPNHRRGDRERLMLMFAPLGAKHPPVL